MDQSGMEASTSAEGRKADSREEELTPTDTEIKLILENEINEKHVYRIHLSPSESENSSGGTTPDACLLNNAPFEMKLFPKLGTEQSTLDYPKVKPEELPQSSHLTPNKVSRPINFDNLSPRSVFYHFSEKYPSGVLRPSKVRRQHAQNVISFSASDLMDQETQNEFESVKRSRSQSDKISDRTGMYENDSNNPPKEKINPTKQLRRDSES